MLARRPAGQGFKQTEVIMKIRASTAAIGAVAALGGAGAFLLPAAASTATVTHTLKFTAVQQATACASARSAAPWESLSS